MGLLDKVEKTKDEKIEGMHNLVGDPEEPELERVDPVDSEIRTTPEQKVKSKPRPVKEQKPRRTRKPKSARQPRTMSDNLIPAKGWAKSFARIVDLIMTWGLCFPAAFFIVGGSDPTLPLLIGLLLMLPNMFFLPIKFGRSIGHIVTQTALLTYKGSKPLFIYFILAATITPSLIFAMFFALIGTSNSAYFIVAAILLGYWLANYITRRVTSASQGIWEAAFGIHHVAYVSEKKATGWVARLEAFGERADKRFNAPKGEDDEPAGADG